MPRDGIAPGARMSSTPWSTAFVATTVIPSAGSPQPGTIDGCARTDHGVDTETKRVALQRELSRLTAPGVLVATADDGRLVCRACAHGCRLRDGEVGLCRVRFRDGPALRVPFGYVAARRIMPVERNTIYHLRPGSLELTFGMFGCDLHCPWCSNASISQAVRADDVDPPPVERVSAAALVQHAIDAGCRVVVSAFTPGIHPGSSGERRPPSRGPEGLRRHREQQRLLHGVPHTYRVHASRVRDQPGRERHRRRSSALLLLLAFRVRRADRPFGELAPLISSYPARAPHAKFR